MRRVAALLCIFSCCLRGQTGGSMSGTLRDTAGAVVAGGLVAAYSQAKPTDNRFAPVFQTTSGTDGTFTFGALPAGTYTLCAEKPDIALLNPCHWAAKQATAVVNPGAATKGVAVTAERGVVLRVRVSDDRGVLKGSPHLDDVMVAVSTGLGPPMTARQESSDAGGRTVTMVVPQAKAVQLLVHSRNLAMADDKGNAYAAANSKVTVTSGRGAGATPAGAAAASAAADLTIHVTGVAAGKP